MTSYVAVEGHVLQVDTVLDDPFMRSIPNFITAEEALYLRELARKALGPSRVVTYGSSDARSSTSCRVPRTDPVASRMIQRAEVLTGLPGTHVEPLQIVHYDPQQKYSPHFDYFNVDSPDYASHTARGGQRRFTLFVNLSGCDGGGATSFPTLEMSFPPIEGRCLFWSNRRPDGVMDKRTLHGGDVVTSGEKVHIAAPRVMCVQFGLNIWVRDGPWVQPTDPPESVFAPAFVLDNGSDDAEPRPTAPPLRVGSLPENATTYTAPPPL